MTLPSSGRLLRDIPKGGYTFRKLTRLAGFCGILAGLFNGLNVLVYGPWTVSKYPGLLAPLRPPVHRVAYRVIELIPFPLVLLTLAGIYAHLPVSRVQKRVLIAVQMAGVIAAPWGLLTHSTAAFVSGLFMLSAGTVWAGILLAVRERKPRWILSAAMAVAGVGRLPFTRYLAAWRMHALGFTIGGITTMAWILVGLTLLAVSTDQPRRVRHHPKRFRHLTHPSNCRSNRILVRIQPYKCRRQHGILHLASPFRV